MQISFNEISFDSIDSTNQEAKRFIKSGNAKTLPTLIWAKQQTDGKGRYDRKWISEEGNVFLSLIIKPDIEAQKLPQISFVATLALEEVISQYIDSDKITFKWPNDVLIDNKKTAGILIESYQNHVIIGVGVNVNSAPVVACNDSNSSNGDNNMDIKMLYPATYISEHLDKTIDIDIENFVSLYTNNLIAYVNFFENKGFEEIKAKWLAKAKSLGEEIKVNLDKEKLSGTFKGLDDQGNLLLKIEGKVKTIAAGDVFPI